MAQTKPPCFGDEHTGECLECAWFTACAEETAVCVWCNGSGEGQYDGTRCHHCHAPKPKDEDWADFKGRYDD